MYTSGLVFIILARISHALASNGADLEQGNILPDEEQELATSEDLPAFDPSANPMDDSKLPAPPILHAQNTRYYIDPDTMFKELCGSFFHAACCIGNQLPVDHDPNGNPIGQSIRDYQNPFNHPDISDLCVWYSHDDPYCDDFIIDNDPNLKLYAILCCGKIKLRPDGMNVAQERRLWPNEDARRRALSSWPNVPLDQKKTPGLGIECHAADKDDIEMFRKQLEEQGTRSQRGSEPSVPPENGNRGRWTKWIDVWKLVPLLLRGVEFIPI